jgi:uncharacterized membrane protein
MAETTSASQAPRETQFVLHPHRSLSPRGFYILMAFIGLVSFVVGLGFLLIGAWPVFGFFGLDAALIYLAFRLNYRDARLYETVSVTPELLKLSRFYPSGQSETFEFNPYWARVRLSTDRPDGRTSLHLGAQGTEVRFGNFLTDDERRAFAHALTGALLASRSAQAF